MEFSKIVNPETNRRARLDTRLGRRVLKKYLKRYEQLAGANNNPTDVTGQRLKKGDRVFFDKDGEHSDDENNLYIVSNTNAETDCHFKNPSGEVQPCSWMNIAKAKDVEQDGLEDAESLRTYFPDHQPGDLEDMKGRHLKGYLSKGVVYHEDNQDQVRKHIQGNLDGEVVSRESGEEAASLMKQK